MIIRVLLSAFFWAATSAVHAAPISIRCTDPNAFTPLFSAYFATFEIETRRVVFEPRNLGGPAHHWMRGGPFLPGTIRNANGDRIEFSASGGSSGDADLVWDRRRGQLVWTGVGGDETKPKAVHPCVVIETRTLLMLMSVDEEEATRQANSPRPFSLRCTDRYSRTFNFTLDTWKKKVVVEGWGSSSYYLAEITSVEGNRVVFRLDLGRVTEFVWDSSASTMTYDSVSGDGSKQKQVDACTDVELRSVMVLYCRWSGPLDPKLCQ